MILLLKSTFLSCSMVTSRSETLLHMSTPRWDLPSYLSNSFVGYNQYYQFVPRIGCILPSFMGYLLVLPILLFLRVYFAQLYGMFNDCYQIVSFLGCISLSCMGCAITCLSRWANSDIPSLNRFLTAQSTKSCLICQGASFGYFL